MSSPGHKPVLRVFVSATSGDLHTVRETVARAILSLGCLPVEQSTSFPPDYRTVEQSLRNLIQGCDAVIHIAGTRYGAEPSPDSLPAATPRRSYTQLEYFMARQLGKKVFVFVCPPDFPYDNCDPEDAEKIALQTLHRDMLLAADNRYEVVKDHAACFSNVLRLQIQFDVLAQQIARDHLRHRIVLAAIAVSLVALLAVGLAQLAGQSRQQKDSQRLAEVVTDLNTEAERIQESVEESVVQRSRQVELAETAAIGIDRLGATVDRMVKAQMIGDVAKRAGADPVEIEQLRLTAKAEGLDNLRYASTLAEMKRFRESVDFSRFLAECALLDDPPDFGSAARAFNALLQAEWDRDDLDDSSLEQARARARLLEANASRGLEAAAAGLKTESADDRRIVANLRVFRAQSLLRLSELQAWRDTDPDEWTDTIDGLTEILAGGPLEEADVARYSTLRSRCLLELASTQSPSEERRSLEDAVASAGVAVEQSCEPGREPDHWASLLAYVGALRALADVLPEADARKPIEEIIARCQERPVVETTPGSQALRYRLDLARLRAQCILARDHLTERDADDSLRKAVQELTDIMNGARERHLVHVRHEAAIMLLRMGELSEWDLKTTFSVANERDSWWRAEDTFAYAEMAESLAFYSLGETTKKQADDAIDDAMKLLDGLPHGISRRPRINGVAESYRVRCLLARCTNSLRFRLRDDYSKANDIAARLIAAYPIDSYSDIHTIAVGCSMRMRAQFGDLTSEEVAAARERILRQLTEASWPHQRAIMEQFFGDMFVELAKPQLAAVCYTRALDFFTARDWPQRNEHLRRKLSGIASAVQVGP